MEEWVTRLGRTATMGVAWAVAWLPFGIAGGRLVVGELEPEHIGGPLFAGFLCGVMFTGLAGIASGRRRLADLSARRAGVYGAASGLFVGVLPFIVGDNGRYQAGWSMIIVAISSAAAGIAAGRKRLGELSSFRSATAAAVVSGLLSGVLSWILTNQNGIERFLPVALIAGLSLMGFVSACLSLIVARGMGTHNSEASAPTL